MEGRFIQVCICVIFTLLSFPQNSIAQTQDKPKLVVGIVIDQMRPEYIQRFYHQFGEDGFKRLIKEGFSCYNTHINYVPTVTGPGHASIYSGTTPKYHGIVENDWYDRNLKKTIYCASDFQSQTIGNDTLSKTSFSARNLLVTTIADELKLSTNKKGKVIATSLKDRGATFPAGHMADGAYWFDQKTGNFVTSNYYIPELPGWVKEFNGKKLADKYIENTWELLLPGDTYHMSTNDDNTFEKQYIGKDKPVFPYNLKELALKKKPFYYTLYASPFGNTLLTDFALEIIKNNQIGQDEFPDLFTISYSSPDAVGHKFGPLSKELNDVYVRLDREIARLLKTIDNLVGKGNYVLFLTADHAVGDISAFLTENNVPGGDIKPNNLKTDLKNALNNEFGEGNWIEAIASNQIYLNKTLINEKGQKLETLQNYIVKVLRDIPGIADVYTSTQLLQQEYNEGIAAMVQKGFNYKRCGDVIYILESGWSFLYDSAADHGSPYMYDTNIPLIWFGNEIKKGESYIHYNVTDIAPTISAILKIKYPSACIGNPIVEIFSK